MAARKAAEEKDEAQVEAQAEESKADEQAVDDNDVEGRADGPINLQVEPNTDKLDGGENYKLTTDVTGRPVAESYTGREFSTLDNEVGDPTIVQPSPGGPTPEAGVALGHNQ